MLACQMSQSEEGMARIEAMCVLLFQFSIYFIIMDTVNCRFYTVIKICIDKVLRFFPFKTFID